MQKYEVSYTVKINEIIPDRSLENNIVEKIESKEAIFSIDEDNILSAELQEKIKEQIRIEDEFHNIISIKKID